MLDNYEQEDVVMYETILVEKKGSVATLTLNRPQAMNAMDLVLREEMRLAFIDLERDNDVRVVVLTGSGKAFCAGGDLSTMGTWTPNSGRTRMRNVHHLYKAISNSDKVFIAAINGHAAGSGLSLACACDFRIAANTAKFGAPFINVGLTPDCGLLYTLPRLIGLARTKEMTMLGQTFTADKAMELGLLTQLVEPDGLWQAVEDLADELCKRSYIALALNKSILNRTFELGLDGLMDYEAYAQDVCFASDAHKEAIAAIMAKQKK